MEDFVQNLSGASRNSGNDAANTGDKSAGLHTIGNLQILRLVAAAMVLFGHLNHEILNKPALALNFVPFEPVWWHCGVDIFFVVSGFIMALITRDSFGKPGEPSRFFRARVVRLVPMYWLFTTLTLVAMALVPGEMHHHTTNWKHVLGSYMLVPLTMNGDGNPRPVMILGWTLNYEMLFYVIFAVAMRLDRRRGLIAVGATLVTLAVAGMIFTLPMPLKVWCNPIILEFLLGMLIHGLWQRVGPLSASAGLAIVAMGYLAMAAFMAAGIANHFDTYRVIWGGVPAAMIASGVLLIREPSASGPIRRWFMQGGDASYALYLSHAFVLSAIAAFFAKAGIINAKLYIVLAFAACLVCSRVFHVTGEKPLHRYLRNRLRGFDQQHRPATLASMKATLVLASVMTVMAGIGARHAWAQAVSPMAPAADGALQSYRLSVGDRLAVAVYGEDKISGPITIDSDGGITLLLAGRIVAGGRTTAELTEAIRAALAAGYLRRPSVTVQVLSFRPYFIGGEVNKPGQYEFSKGLTVVDAVAVAAGFTYRARKTSVFITHRGDLRELRVAVTPSLTVAPGDTIRVGERYF